MELTEITAISPLDGRYGQQTELYRTLFSEYNLIKQRIIIEIEWLKQLSYIPEVGLATLEKSTEKFLDTIIEKFDTKECAAIKDIEMTIKHDVKAVEYYLRQKLSSNPETKKLVNYVHFACTSEDINNIAYGLILKESREILAKRLQAIQHELKSLSSENTNSAMLSRTHGQYASPTTFGKEIAVFNVRLHRQIQYFNNVEILAKFNGAVGNFHAHAIAYPNVNWPAISKQFIERFNLGCNLYTTQIEPRDYMAEYFQVLVRCNNILLDFCRDIWGYISLGYLKLKNDSTEVGSSTMPHKINPIDFENAEGNLGFANSNLNFLANKLTISRWQRDLSDSTCLRNIGSTLTYCILAYENIIRGISKISVDQDIINHDLHDKWQVLAEAVQTIMRKYNIDNPYEKIKELTRGKTVSKDILHKFINELDLPENEKNRLLSLKPEDYTGITAI